MTAGMATAAMAPPPPPPRRRDNLAAEYAGIVLSRRDRPRRSGSRGEVMLQRMPLTEAPETPGQEARLFCF